MAKRKKVVAEVVPAAYSMDWRTPLGVAAGAWFVYFFTMYRELGGGDTGEMVLVGCSGDTAHPPGYPLYSLLARIFCAVPIAAPAARVNFLSVCCASIAVFLLTVVVMQLTRQRWAAFLAGGMFAFAPLIWTTAIVAEVFALNNVIILSVIYLAIKFEQTHDLATKRQLTYGIGFVAALGLSNHHGSVFLNLPVVLFILLCNRAAMLRSISIPGLLGAGVLGLSPYAYLVYLGHHPQVGTWSDTSTLEGLLYYFLRRQYGTLQLAGEALGFPISFATKMYVYLSDTAYCTLYAGLALGIMGCILSVRRSALMRVLAAGFTSYWLVLLALSNIQLNFPLYFGIGRRLWQQLAIFIYIWLGVASARYHPRLRSWAAPLSVAAVLIQLGLNFGDYNRSRDHAFVDLAHTVLDPLPAHAILLASGDHVYDSLRYYQNEARIRPDVDIIAQFKMLQTWPLRALRHAHPSVVFPGIVLSPQPVPHSFTLEDFLQANIGQRPIYVVNGFTLPDKSHEKSFLAWPMGYVEQVLPRTQDYTLATWLALDQKFDQGLNLRQLRQYPAESWEREILRQYWHQRHRYAVALYQFARAHNNDRAALTEATHVFERIIDQSPYVDAQIWKNAGATYQVLASYDAAASQRMQHAWQTFLRLAPEDSDAVMIRQFMTTH